MMNKPHVESLIYKVIFSEDVDYDKAPPLKEETNHFICTIDQGKAVFEMKTHFQKEEEARKVIRNNAFNSLTDKEQKWLLDLIKNVVIRHGNYAYNPSQPFSKITFNDLPDLS